MFLFTGARKYRASSLSSSFLMTPLGFHDHFFHPAGVRNARQPRQCGAVSEVLRQRGCRYGRGKQREAGFGEKIHTRHGNDSDKGVKKGRQQKLRQMNFKAQQKGGKIQEGSKTSMATASRKAGERVYTGQVRGPQREQRGDLHA